MQLNLIDFGLGVQDAMSPQPSARGAATSRAGRHNYDADRWRVSPDLVKALEAMGHKVTLANAPGYDVGIFVDPRSGSLSGGTIGARNGQAVGF